MHQNKFHGIQAHTGSHNEVTLTQYDDKCAKSEGLLYKVVLL